MRYSNMKCAILNCQNSYQKNQLVSYHKFPDCGEVLNAWVAATGVPNFIPTNNSKICSEHFDESAYAGPRKLNYDSVPTKFLRISEITDSAGLSAEQDRSRQSVTDPLSCILSTDASLNKVALVRDNVPPTPKSLVVSKSHNYLNAGPSSSHNLQSFMDNTVVLNYNRTSSPSNQLNRPARLNMARRLIPISRPRTVIPTNHSPHPAQQLGTSSYHQSPTRPSSSTIKLVDMKKLLQPQPANFERHTSVIGTLRNGEDHVQTNGVPNKRKTILNLGPNKKEKLSEKVVKRNTTSCNNQYKVNTPQVQTSVTVCQVLTCLRVMLPGKFDLSKMIPNEKVASLVIRYLKLDENDPKILNHVKNNLKIIIDAAKAKDKPSSGYLKHPYTKINDKTLQNALTRVLPENFSMMDISNEVLNLICISLNQDIHSDSFHILRRKIRKFTSEGQKFNEILNFGGSCHKVYLGKKAQTGMDKTCYNMTDSEEISDSNEVIGIIDKPPVESNADEIHCEVDEPVFVDVNNPSRDELISGDEEIVLLPVNETEDVEPRNCKKRKKGNDTEWNCEKQPALKKPALQRPALQKPALQTPVLQKPALQKPALQKHALQKPVLQKSALQKSALQKPALQKPISQKPALKQDSKPVSSAERLDVIVEYLSEKKISARSVLSNFHHMFYLCKFLRIRSRSPNVKRLRAALHFIIKNNIDLTNVKNYLREFIKSQRLLVDNKQSSSEQQNSKNNMSKPELKKKIVIDKLKLKPVVVLQNLIDYGKEQMLFMTEKSYPNGFYSRTPFSFKQNRSHKKYSSEYVRKVTNDSYKQFRKIVMKKDGPKIVFRVKFATLATGSVVFAKDFRYPCAGWVKGTVKKLDGPLKYEVQLENGDSWKCFADQLRPLSESTTNNVKKNLVQRTHRAVKPKQILNL